MFDAHHFLNEKQNKQPRLPLTFRPFPWLQVLTRVSFSTHTVDHLPDDWCKNGTSVALTYEEQPKWRVYVSLEDRALIRYHMLAMSGFLFALSAVVFVGAFFREGNKKKKRTGFSRPAEKAIAFRSLETFTTPNVISSSGK